MGFHSSTGTGFHRRGRGASSDYLSSRDKANQTALARLREEGLLDEFLAYQQGPGTIGQIWNTVKSAGSGALDILQRGEYATAGIADVSYEGGTIGDMMKRAGSELFSGVGGIKGQKETFGKVVRQHYPGYEQWSEEHPVASFGTDLAMSIGLDPTTYLGGAIYKGIAKPVKYATRTIGGSKAGQAFKSAAEPITETIGKAFRSGYGWKKAGVKAGHEIAEEERHLSAYVKRKYAGRLDKSNLVVDSWKTPEGAVKAEALIRIMKGDLFKGQKLKSAEKISIVRQQYGDEIADVYADYTQTLKIAGRLEKIAGTKTVLKDDYFPNRAKALTDLMEEAGDYNISPFRMGMGGKDIKAGFERGQVLKTGDDMMRWLQETGVKPEDYAEVILRNVNGRLAQGAERMRVLRMHKRWTEELPDVFRKLPAGTKTVFSLGEEGAPLLQKGETLWMPKGNLRFFPTEVIEKLPDDVIKFLDEGGAITPEIMEKLKNVKDAVSVTTRVPAYAIPVEIMQEIDKAGVRLGEPGTMWAAWDKFLNLWKNAAITSPFFHNRNFIGSGFQNYLAFDNVSTMGMRYKQALQILTSKDDLRVIAGKPVKVWKNLFDKHGVSGGSFVGQMTSKTDIPLFSDLWAKTGERLFKANRWIGRHVEEISRAPLFMDEMLKNGDAIAAANKVKKFHFDYTELTDFERNAMRRIMPFYTWSRRNIPLQLEMLFKAPGKYRNVAKLKEAISGGADSENAPEWWKEQDVWETKLQDKQGQRYGVLVGLPYSDLNQLTRNPTGSFGPVGTIGNLMRNIDPFFNKPISEFPGQTKYGIPAQIQYALSQFVPLFKRYGFDMVDDTPEMIKYMKGEEADFNKAYRGFSKFVGARLLKLTDSQKEKNRIYKLMGDLRNYGMFQKQETGAR